MTSPIRKYAFINAKLRARISNLFSEDALNRMMSVQTLDEALGFLRDTNYGVLDEVYGRTGDLKLGELELLRKEIELFTELEKYVKGVELELIQALVIRYEIDNLKNALRLYFDRKIRHRNIDMAVPYILHEKIRHDISIDSIINAENIEEISQSLIGTPYARIIEENMSDVLKDGSLFILEIALDHYYYKNLIGRAENLSPGDRKETLRIIGVEIDLQNINWIVRFRGFYDLPLEEALNIIIPSGFNLSYSSFKEAYASQNVTQILQGVVKVRYPGLSTLLSSQTTDSSSRLLLIERILERIMLHEIRRIMTGYPFTIGIILSYFILKKNEIKKVQTILNAKQYNIPVDRIKGVI